MCCDPASECFCIPDEPKFIIVPGLFEQRQKEKQASRDEDARAFAAGEKTVEQLQKENCKFSFPGAVINWDSAKRRW